MGHANYFSKTFIKTYIVSYKKMPKRKHPPFRFLEKPSTLKNYNFWSVIAVQHVQCADGMAMYTAHQFLRSRPISVCTVCADDLSENLGSLRSMFFVYFTRNNNSIWFQQIKRAMVYPGTLIDRFIQALPLIFGT